MSELDDLAISGARQVRIGCARLSSYLSSLGCEKLLQSLYLFLCNHEHLPLPFHTQITQELPCNSQLLHAFI